MLQRPRHNTMWNGRQRTMVAMAVVALCAAFAGEAQAACASTPPKNPWSVPRLQFDGRNSGHDSFQDSDRSGPAESIVGLWGITFYLGNGPAIYDQGFEQFHSDGTELMVDNAVPPALGNVCIGVWKQAGRTIKLRHVTWNWNTDGTPAGTFLLLMTLTVDRRGNTFSGTYVADSFDLQGQVIPALHAEGTARATRITVD